MLGITNVPPPPVAVRLYMAMAVYTTPKIYIQFKFHITVEQSSFKAVDVVVIQSLHPQATIFNSQKKLPLCLPRPVEVFGEQDLLVRWL